MAHRIESGKMQYRVALRMRNHMLLHEKHKVKNPRVKKDESSGMWRVTYERR